MIPPQFKPKPRCSRCGIGADYRINGICYPCWKAKPIVSKPPGVYVYWNVEGKRTKLMIMAGHYCPKGIS